MKHNYFFILISIFLVGTVSAQAPVVTSILGPNAVCASPSAPATWTAIATNTPTNYIWGSIPSGVTFGAPNSSVTTVSFPNTNATYTLICQGINGFGGGLPKTFTVQVFETPTVTFSGGNSFCQGSSTNISASSTLLSASSTISYNWSPSASLSSGTGSLVVASPSTTTTYSVTGTVGFCSNTSVITVTVNPKPVITTVANPSVVCLGGSTSLVASGANTYTWSGGVVNAITFTPSATNTYSVIGTSALGCTNSAVNTITVTTIPNITVSSNTTAICSGATATLNFSGANSYSLNAISSSSTTVISPTATTVYTVSGSNAPGCTGYKTYTQVVSLCIGIEEYEAGTVNLNAYPNPGTDHVTLISKGRNENVTIVNELGQLVLTVKLEADKEIRIEGLNTGLYFVIAPSQRLKILIQQ